MRVSDQIRAHRNTTGIASDVWDEGEDGKWAVLRPGLVCVHSGCHTCHESTWRQLLQAVRDAQPCDCPECRRSLETE